MGATRLLHSLCVLFACTSKQVVDQDLVETQCQTGQWRLPRRVIPVHYELALQMDPSAVPYDGVVAIDLKFDEAALKNDPACSKGTSSRKDSFACNPATIILHAGSDVNIHRVEFSETGYKNPIEVAGICRDHETSQLVVSLKRAPHWKSTGKLTLWFTGKVSSSDKQRGLFRSSYVGANNEDKPILVTNFDSLYARSAFPVFDEPDLKATFGLTIGHLPGMKALSNMPPVEESRQKDHVEVQFERTPRMSSYLLAFAVGQFDHIEATILDGQMTMGVWTPPGRARDASLSLKRATRAFEILLDYFKIEQPIKTINFLAVDDLQGVKENWGLITFQTAILLDGHRERTTVANELYGMTAIVQQLASQWFGNLVTIRWWDDWWLNEGFAEWIASKACHELYPELDCELYFLVSKTTPALDADNPMSRPVEQPGLKTTNDIEVSFNDISLKKVGALIRMLSSYAGEELFDEGRRSYMIEHLENNARAEDLWAALKKYTQLDVASIVDTWIHQAGYPLVEVRRSGKSLVLTQSMFIKLPGLIYENYKWWKIPISVVVSDGGDRTIRINSIMDDYEHRIRLPAWFDLDKSGHWLKVNANFEGFYRVKYDEFDRSLRRAFRNAIETKSMGPADRLNLVADTRALYMAEVIDSRELLRVLSWFKSEDNDGVIIELIRLLLKTVRLSEINRPQIADIYANLKRYYWETGGVTQVEGESLLRTMARADLLVFLIHMRDPDAIKDSLDLYRNTKGEIAPFIQEGIYMAVALEGNPGQFVDLLARVNEIAWEHTRSGLVRLMRSVLAKSLRLKVFEEYFGVEPIGAD